MSTLSRNSLEDGSYSTKLELPHDLRWTPTQVEQSLAATMGSRPPGEIWVFAYGSLMWNPLIHYVERENAALEGWHRSFCLMSFAGRGSRECPGRMLALEPGGRTDGVALRLCDDSAEFELKLLWAREMVAGSYEPRWETVTLADGREVPAIVFVANPANSHYAKESDVGSIAPIIARAGGSFGSNAEYVSHLNFALVDAGLEDPYVDALICELKSLADTSHPPPKAA